MSTGDGRKISANRRKNEKEYICYTRENEALATPKPDYRNTEGAACGDFSAVRAPFRAGFLSRPGLLRLTPYNSHMLANRSPFQKAVGLAQAQQDGLGRAPVSWPRHQHSPETLLPAAGPRRPSTCSPGRSPLVPVALPAIQPVPPLVLVGVSLFLAPVAVQRRSRSGAWPANGYDRNPAHGESSRCR